MGVLYCTEAVVFVGARFLCSIIVFLAVSLLNGLVFRPYGLDYALPVPLVC